EYSTLYKKRRRIRRTFGRIGFARPFSSSQASRRTDLRGTSHARPIASTGQRGPITTCRSLARLVAVGRLECVATLHGRGLDMSRVGLHRRLDRLKSAPAPVPRATESPTPITESPQDGTRELAVELAAAFGSMVGFYRKHY